jgi:hypothetical protein
MDVTAAKQKRLADNLLERGNQVNVSDGSELGNGRRDIRLGISTLTHSTQLKHESCETEWILRPPHVVRISCLTLQRYNLHQPSRPQVLRGSTKPRCSLLH